MGATDSIECKMKFEIPDGYFDTLADNVIQRIDYDNKCRKRRRNKVLRTIGAAVAVIIVAGAAVLWQQAPQSNLPQNEQQQFSSHYITHVSQKYSDINVIEYIDQANNESDDIEDYDSELVAMYASPVNFMY